MSASRSEIDSLPLKLLLERFPGEILHHHEQHGDATVVIRRERMLEVFRHLRRDAALSFEFLMDECGVDRLLIEDRFERFEVVCHLYSLTHNHRLRVRVAVPEEDPVVDSLTAVWRSANWFEREIWDMYGIRFRGHPDLRRLLLYDQFEGHPLRKNYPITKRQPLVGPLN
jgi:NADH-quinone oxidoreductase subunit C